MGGGDDGYDVIVVGCGIAGLSAAVSAQQAGARVALLERAPKEERGGNTRYTESFWRMQSHDAVSEDFWDRFAENAGGHLDPAVIEASVKPYDEWPGLLRGLGFVDPELVATLADNAGPTLRWLTGFGVAFDFLPNYFITESTTRMAPAGGGLALVEALAAHAESVPDRIAIHYETTARRLIQDDEGRANGVEATGANNRTTRLRAHAVVLASGGFEGNPEMLSRYLGPQSQFIRPVARGGYYNRGEGIRMALEIGAAPCGDYGSFHAQPVDPRSGQHEPVVLNYPYHPGESRGPPLCRRGAGDGGRELRGGLPADDGADRGHRFRHHRCKARRRAQLAEVGAHRPAPGGGGGADRLGSSPREGLIKSRVP